MTQSSDTNKGERVIVHIDAELEDLIPGFLENRRNDIISMLNALEKGDYETIRVLGHSMKGSGGGYGFDAITDMGASLEQAAKVKNSEEIKKMVDELSAYLNRVEVIYE